MCGSSRCFKLVLPQVMVNVNLISIEIRYTYICLNKISEVKLPPIHPDTHYCPQAKIKVLVRFDTVSQSAL